MVGETKLVTLGLKYFIVDPSTHSKRYKGYQQVAMVILLVMVMVRVRVMMEDGG